MGVASTDAAFAQPVQYGGWIDGEVSGDSGEGPSEVVEVDRFVNLAEGQATSSRRNVVSMQDRAHGSAVDTESIAQLGCRPARNIVLDHGLGLVCTESVCPPTPEPFGGHRWWR